MDRRIADFKCIEPERRRGRPRMADPGSSVSTWLRTDEHDRLIRLAMERETTVSALVRSLVILRLP